MKKVIPISKVKENIPTEFDTKHLSVFNEIKKFIKISSSPKSFDYQYPITKKTKICFILLPEWDKNFVPYNISRLIAVSRHAGYETTGIDLNIEAWHDSKRWSDQSDFWHASSEWKWTGNSYWDLIHPHILPLLEKTVNDIINQNFDVIGLTLYYCNLEISNWLAKELKKLKPSIKIIVGGPQAHHSYWTPILEYDVIVSGEGEDNLLVVLDKIENNNIESSQSWIRQMDGIRIDLDAVPAPDFSWADFSRYGMPNGVLLEFSRGCVAKCTFCGETHFWKYRGRRSDKLVEEIEKLHKEHGIDTVWFLDSLVNGNLKELRNFAKGIIDKKIKIQWTGYARCDDRMDLDYYKDLKNSGCFALNYGIESGSNKILRDMAKGITVDEIEKNLCDGTSVGIKAMTNWIHSFPTESYQDFYETLTLIIRNHQNIYTMAPGIGGFIVASDTIVGQNFDRFNLLKAKWEGEWITKDFKNTKLHRLMRQKILLLVMNEVGLNDGHYVDFYKINFADKKKQQIEYENFNFDVINPSINPLADSFLNEIFVLLRLLWKWRGAYNLEFVFDKNKDRSNFGDRLSCDAEGKIYFCIDTHGDWNISIDYNFRQTHNWVYHGYDQANSIAAKRARQLSKKEFKEEFTYEDLCQDIKIMDKLSHLDFSFEYQHSHNGNW